MQEAPILFSHDAFLKFVLKHETEARSFFKGALPENIAREIDFQSLRLTDSSYVDETLRQSFSDLVYIADGKEETKFKLMLIVEHKSKLKAGYEKFQLNGYFYLAGRIELKKKLSERRIPILLMVANGIKNVRLAPIWKLFGENAENFKAGIPDFECTVMDFSAFDDDKINHLFDSFKVRAMIRVMRDYKQKVALLKSIDLAFSDLLAHSDQKHETDFIYALFNYVISTADIEINDIDNTIEKYSIINFDNMTLAEKLLKKGKHEGMQQGMQKGEILGMYKIALRMIKNDHSNAIIEDLTGLHPFQIEKLRKLFAIHGEETTKHLNKLID